MRKFCILLLAMCLCGCNSINWDKIWDELEPVKPEPEPPSQTYPWDGQSINKGSGDKIAAFWPQTIEIHNVTLSGGLVRFPYKGATPKSLGWRQTNKIGKSPSAVVGYMIKRNNQWYQVIGEWLPPGYDHQTYHMFDAVRTHNGKTKRFFEDKLEPQSADYIWIFVCGLNWKGQANVQERSNFVRVDFP